MRSLLQDRRIESTAGSLRRLTGHAANGAWTDDPHPRHEQRDGPRDPDSMPHSFEARRSCTESRAAELLTDDYICGHPQGAPRPRCVLGRSWRHHREVFGASVDQLAGKLRLKSRFLGYGEVDPDRALFSTDQRVVMLGWDSLECDHAHTYRVPLPPSLSGKKVKRRLSVSLAWFSPINPRHKDYRRALLWFSSNKKPLALDKKDLDFDSARRGTVQHQIFEGDKARAFSDGDAIAIKVSCVEDAGSFTDKIPYASRPRSRSLSPST